MESIPHLGSLMMTICFVYWEIKLKYGLNLVKSTLCPIHGISFNYPPPPPPPPPQSSIQQTYAFYLNSTHSRCGFGNAISLLSKILHCFDHSGTKKSTWNAAEMALPNLISVSTEMVGMFMAKPSPIEWYCCEETHLSVTKAPVGCRPLSNSVLWFMISSTVPVDCPALFILKASRL